MVTLVRLEADGGVTGRRRVLVLRAEDPVADRFASARTDGSLRIWSSLTKARGGVGAREGREKWGGAGKPGARELMDGVWEGVGGNGRARERERERQRCWRSGGLGKWEWRWEWRWERGGGEKREEKRQARSAHLVRRRQGKEWSVQAGLRPPAQAALDFDLRLRRVADAGGAACVDTPKGYTQCQPPGFWEAAQ